MSGLLSMECTEEDYKRRGVSISLALSKLRCKSRAEAHHKTFTLETLYYILMHTCSTLRSSRFPQICYQYQISWNFWGWQICSFLWRPGFLLWNHFPLHTNKIKTTHSLTAYDLNLIRWSIYICVFCRKPSGHADKEVMAATVLTSLSTSPLVLHPSSASTGNNTASASAVFILAPDDLPF